MIIKRNQINIIRIQEKRIKFDCEWLSIAKPEIQT